jgi:hypothetical protein
MNETPWLALLVVTAALDQLRSSLDRCVIASPYKNQLCQQVEAMAERRAQLLQQVCDSVSDDPSRPDLTV